MATALNRYRTYAVLEVGRKYVLYYILTAGTNKLSTISLDDYLRNLPNVSSANYLRMSNNSKKFNKDERRQISRDSSCASFDFTLLCKAILLACEGFHLAEVCPRNDLEHYIVEMKDCRNECHHGPHKIEFRNYQETSNKLRMLYHDALRAAGKRYTKPQVEIDHNINRVDSELEEIAKEVLGEEDLLTYCGPQMKVDLISEADAKLREILQTTCTINPVSFLTGMNVDIDIQDVFTKIRVKEGNRGEDGQIMSHTNVLSAARAQPGCKAPQALLMEGLAGSGKTTLLTLVGAEWLKDRQQHTIIGLNNYSLLLRVQCRDRGVTSLKELLEIVVPKVFIKFRGLLVPLFQTCSVLILIDGLDEANPDSTNLIDNILQCMRCTENCTLLFTSRPEVISTFERKIPADYKKTYIELMGVAETQRETFVQRYHHEMQLKIGCTQDTIGFLNRVKDLLWLEHFRLPLNMVLLTWICLKKPDVIVPSMNQIQLYQLSYDLCFERLVDRVTPRITVTDQTLRFLLKECLQVLQKECLIAIPALQLSVEGRAQDHIRTTCEPRVPADDVLSSFLSLRMSRSAIGILEKQYIVPHKSLQEFYAALYVVDHPSLSAASGSIRVVVQDTLGTPDIQWSHFKNTLRYVAALLHLASRNISDDLSKEVVDLLWESGVRKREEWLDVVEETKAAPRILHFVGYYFPVRYGALNITDSHVWSYTALLPFLPCSSIAISLEWDLMGKEAELDALINALDDHECKELQLYHHYRHADPGTYSDRILQDVLPRSDLKMFAGHLSAAGAGLLPEDLVDLELALTGNIEACMVVQELYQRRLYCLRVHVPLADVEPKPLIPLPPARDVHLHLTGVTETLTTKAACIAAALQPPEGYWCVWFPKSTLGAEGWGGLLGAMSDFGVGVQWSVLIPENSISKDAEAFLETIARSRLGCAFRTNEFDGW